MRPAGLLPAMCQHFVMRLAAGRTCLTGRMRGRHGQQAELKRIQSHTPALSHSIVMFKVAALAWERES